MKYRKKPAVFDAFQMTAERHADPDGWPDWLKQVFGTPRYPYDFSPTMYFYTPEGMNVVRHGDWILRAADGGLRHCTSSTFEATYEPAE